MPRIICFLLVKLHRTKLETYAGVYEKTKALFHEFDGRIIFQQAGWEPPDAYLKLLEECEAKKASVVHDLALVVCSYFRHNFVHADEKKARFYFEKPCRSVQQRR